MAEGKKSFVLYADMLKSISHLTKEERGILFTHLLEYVNDLNPVMTDRLLLTAWIPIELQLKRDLKKFEAVREKRSEAGKISAEKRKQQKEHMLTHVESVQHRSTNSTDICNMISDTDMCNNVISDTETNVLLKKEPKAPKKKNDVVSIEKIDLKPFPESFRPEWEKWIFYKKTEHKQTYKRIETQQTAFKHLLELSEGDPSTASKIIQQSVANQYKGLFKLKDDSNQKKQSSPLGTHKIGSNWYKQL